MLYKKKRNIQSEQIQYDVCFSRSWIEGVGNSKHLIPECISPFLYNSYKCIIKVVNTFRNVEGVEVKVEKNKIHVNVLAR